MPQPESVAHWLRFARSDLASARVAVGPGILWETPCFDAQQAAEKAIKAILISLGIRPPRIHDLDELLRLLSPHLAPPATAAGVGQLTQYASLTRYPGLRRPVSEADYREALRLAEAVVAWAAEVTGA